MYVKYMYVCVLYRLVSQRLQRRRLRSVQPGHIHLLLALALAGPVHLRPIWLAGGLHPVRIIGFAFAFVLPMLRFALSTSSQSGGGDGSSAGDGGDLGERSSVQYKILAEGDDGM